jgi:stress responsive alpha/beta barrel protein
LIRHALLFKLKPGITEQERDSWMVEVRGLARAIPMVRALTIGADLMHLPRSYDVALVVDFDSVEDLLAYERHPAHVRVAAISRTVAEHTLSVDFEWQPEALRTPA